MEKVASAAFIHHNNKSASGEQSFFPFTFSHSFLRHLTALQLLNLPSHVQQHRPQPQLQHQLRLVQPLQQRQQLVRQEYRCADPAGHFGMDFATRLEVKSLCRKHVFADSIQGINRSVEVPHYGPIQ